MKATSFARAMAARIVKLAFVSSSRSFCSGALPVQCRPPQQVLVKDGGLHVQWSQSHASFYHREWLHRNRPGVLSSSGQNMQESCSNAPDGIGSATLNGEKMTIDIVWTDEDLSVSEYPVNMLLEHDCSSEALNKRKMQRRPTPLKERNGGIVPRISYERVMTSEDGVFEWMDHVMRDGLCIVHDTPCHEEGQVFG